MPTLRLAHTLSEELLREEPETQFRWGVAMAACPEWGTRSAAGWFIGAHYGEHPVEAQSLLPDLADDDNWSIREGAAFGLARVLSDHFDEVLPLFRRWAHHASVNVRRAVVISTMPVVRQRGYGDHRARACLDLLEPLLSDPEPYIRKNLGPFAIGTALLNHHSNLTFAALAEWRDRYDDQWVRWNLAMAVSSSGGRRRRDESLAFLDSLEGDARPTVIRAVTTARRALLKPSARQR